MNFPFPHGFLAGAGAGFDPNIWYSLNDRVGSPTTWSPTDKNALLALGNANMLVTSSDSTTQKLIRVTNAIAPSAGKTYWELTLAGQGPAASSYLTILGQMIGGTSVANGKYLTLDGQGCGEGYASDTGQGYQNGWNTAGSGVPITNGVWAFAYDSVAGTFYIGNGGVWYPSGLNSDPFQATAPNWTRAAAAAPMFPGMSMLTAVNGTLNSGPSFNSPCCSIVGPRQGDSSTKLLLHCDGPNVVFPDRGTPAHYFTPSPGVTIDTTVPKFGSGCASFNGSNGYLYQIGNTGSDFTFGIADFTIDLWFRMRGAGSYTLLDWQPGAGGAYVTLGINAAGKIIHWVNGGYIIIGTTTLSPNTWYHCALARASGTTKLFINGVQEGSSYADSWNYLGAANRPLIGIWGTDATTWPMWGYMDEIRISKGIARWTSNFTPPTVPYT